MSEWQEIKQAFLECVRTHRQLCEAKRLARMAHRFLRYTKKYCKKRDALNEEVKKYNAKYGENMRLAR